MGGGGRGRWGVCDVVSRRGCRQRPAAGRRGPRGAPPPPPPPQTPRRPGRNRRSNPRARRRCPNTTPGFLNLLTARGLRLSMRAIVGIAGWAGRRLGLRQRLDRPLCLRGVGAAVDNKPHRTSSTTLATFSSTTACLSPALPSPALPSSRRGRRLPRQPHRWICPCPGGARSVGRRRNRRGHRPRRRARHTPSRRRPAPTNPLRGPLPAAPAERRDEGATPEGPRCEQRGCAGAPRPWLETIALAPGNKRNVSARRHGVRPNATPRRAGHRRC